MDLEELITGVYNPDTVSSPRKKRKLRRMNREHFNLAYMPYEVLEVIFLALDPQTVCAATSVNRRFAYIGTNALLCFLYSLFLRFTVP